MNCLTFRWVNEHEEHKDTLLSFDTLIKDIISLNDMDKREVKIREFYNIMCDYVVGDFQHMKLEVHEIWI